MVMAWTHFGFFLSIVGSTSLTKWPGPVQVVLFLILYAWAKSPLSSMPFKIITKLVIKQNFSRLEIYSIRSNLKYNQVESSKYFLNLQVICLKVILVYVSIVENTIHHSDMSQNAIPFTSLQKFIIYTS